MAVSKRLRFEILRRDGHACRYCGRTAPEVKLTIDHVTPTALGGTDAPENLAAACAECNNGKTSVPADAAVVADVAQKVVAWAVARKRVAAEMEQEFTDQTAAAKRIRSVFMKACKEEHGAEPKIPADWCSSISRWLQLGISEARAKELAAYAACRRNVPLTAKWKYLAASCWAVIREMEDQAQKLVDPIVQMAPALADCTCMDDHSTSSCLVDALLCEWSDEWKLASGSRPSRALDEPFMRRAYELLDDDSNLKSDLFLAAQLAARNGSADISEYLPEATLRHCDDPTERATDAWIAHWIQQDNKPLPSDEERALFASHLKAAISATYSPEGIVLMASCAGQFCDPDLSRYLASIVEMLAVDGDEPWPDLQAPGPLSL